MEHRHHPSGTPDNVGHGEREAAHSRAHADETHPDERTGDTAMEHAGHDHAAMDHAAMEHGPEGHGSAAGIHVHPPAAFETRFWVSLLLTLPVLALSEMIQIWLGFRLDFPGRPFVLLALAAAIYAYGGGPFLSGAAVELRGRRPGMMTLVATAITVAFLYSAATVVVIRGMDFFWELATLVDVMLLGHWLEAKSVLGASRALEALARVMPSTAHVVRGSAVADVPASELHPGDRVLVRPGEKVPADGTVDDGESSVVEAALTGESRPVPKGRGAVVIGGSVNGEGALTVRVDKTGEETYLAQVIRLVRDAQRSRTRTQDLADRSAALLFYVAVSVAAITFAAWLSSGRADFALTRAVTVLVIACPHALGLAIPLVVALSTSITARSGSLIRDRRAFESARRLDAVVFDKTGTLTEGRFDVTDVVSLLPEADLLRLAGAVESRSEHVIARAIAARAEHDTGPLAAVQDFRAIPGKGVFGRVDGREVYAGNAALNADLGVAFDDIRLEAPRAAGRTVVFVIVDGKPAGALALADVVRPESAEAVRDLKAMGLRVMMITGDAPDVARAVGSALGIDDVMAQVLPDRKAAEIARLEERGLWTAMVGDGVNDAPALVTADVGIAIGAGTDVAVESADIVLVRNDPREVARIIAFSRRTYRKMVQNLWWAAGYNIVAIPLAAGVLARRGVVINPALGALLMSLSTVLVAVNSQLLRRAAPARQSKNGK